MLGRGKIDISIRKTRYTPGDIISGEVTLTLKKPVKATEMTISLIGEYVTKVTTGRHLVAGTSRVGGSLRQHSRGMLMSDTVRKSAPKYDYKTKTKTVQICGFKQQLDGEIEYSQSKEYRFKIKITTDMPTSSAVDWYMLAKLDIPHGRDITKKVRITIG